MKELSSTTTVEVTFVAYIVLVDHVEHDRLAVEDKEYARNPSEVEQSSFVLNKGNFIDFKRLHQHDTTT